MSADPSFRTVLIPERQSLLGPMGCSVLLHGGAVIGAVAARGGMALLLSFLPWCTPEPPPLIVPDVEVSMVSLPKRLNVPDRMARVQRASGVTPPKPDEPPPIKESDLVVHKEEPEPKPGNTEAPVDRPDAAAEKARQELLEDFLNAPEGTVDRDATDPDGMGDAKLAALGAQSLGDPAFARWTNQVQALLQQKFQPLGSSGGLKATAQLRIDPESGRILSSNLSKPSGVLSFDSAAQRAIDAAGNLPVPPEKYWPLLQVEFIEINLSKN